MLYLHEVVLWGDALIITVEEFPVYIWGLSLAIILIEHEGRLEVAVQLCGVLRVAQHKRRMVGGHGWGIVKFFYPLEDTTPLGYATGGFIMQG